MTEHNQGETNTRSDGSTLPRLLRWLGSFVIALHLAAVILPPLSFQSRGPLGISPAVETAIAPLEGYGQFLYIDRGYAFFAPDPGPSHLIQAAVTDQDGTKVEKMIPDLDDQWPRLLYHRYFMLSEYLHSIYQQPGPPQELIQVDRQEAELWRQMRLRYESVRQSIVKHLNEANPGQQVAIRRVEHLIPDLSIYLEQPIALDDPQLYRVLLDQPVGAESIAEPVPVPNDQPAPESDS
jgi:hypothetical protein